MFMDAEVLVVVCVRVLASGDEAHVYVRTTHAHTRARRSISYKVNK